MSRIFGILLVVVIAVAVIINFSFRRDGNGDSTSNTARSPFTNAPSSEEAVAELADPSPLEGSRAEAEFSTRRAESVEAVLDERFAPSNDGWNSERLSDKASGMVNRLAQQLTDLEVDGGLGSFDECVCYDLRPLKDAREKRRAGLTILEQVKAAQRVGSIRAGMQRLAKPFKNERAVRVKTKLFDVRSGAGFLETRSLFESFGESDTGLVQQNATWNCRWKVLQDGDVQLIELRVEEFVESHSKTSQTWFRDDTARVLAGNTSYNSQLLFGMNHWLKRIEERQGIHDSGRNGIAVGDVNGDGLDDLYVCQPGGLPNRMLVNSPDGTATDISVWAGVDWLDETSAALLVDIDNDGDQDLVLGFMGSILLMSNRGNGQFDAGTRIYLADEDVKSICAADYDQDGKLDLYVCVDQAADDARPKERRPSFVYFDANEGGANVLLHNKSSDGGFEFVDVTRQVGLDVNNRRHSLAACWEDFDNDGDQDLYVANDYGRNCHYRNDNGKFVDVAEELGTVDYGSGMSADWGDYNNDQRMDLYVGNMWSSAGGRITSQPGFRPDLDSRVRGTIRRFAKGNTLFANGGQRFQDVGSSAGVEMGRWAWSSLFGDLNNDGWLDLLVANGYLTTSDDRDL